MPSTTAWCLPDQCRLHQVDFLRVGFIQRRIIDHQNPLWRSTWPAASCQSVAASGSKRCSSRVKASCAGTGPPGAGRAPLPCQCTPSGGNQKIDVILVIHFGRIHPAFLPQIRATGVTPRPCSQNGLSVQDAGFHHTVRGVEHGAVVLPYGRAI